MAPGYGRAELQIADVPDCAIQDPEGECLDERFADLVSVLDDTSRVAEFQIRPDSILILTLPAGEYRLEVQGPRHVCPDNVSIVAGGSTKVQLLWPVAQPCGEQPPVPKGQPPPD